MATNKKPKQTDAEEVAAFLQLLEHPLKTGIIELYKIILATDSKLQERIKWNAPSFYYNKYDLAAFHLRQHQYIHLIMVFPTDTDIASSISDPTGLLEANHKDRRELKFYSMDDIAAKTPALQRIVQDWIKLVDERLTAASEK